MKVTFTLISLLFTLNILASENLFGLRKQSCDLVFDEYIDFAERLEGEYLHTSFGVNSVVSCNRNTGEIHRIMLSRTDAERLSQKENSDDLNYYGLRKYQLMRMFPNIQEDSPDVLFTNIDDVTIRFYFFAGKVAQVYSNWDTSIRNEIKKTQVMFQLRQLLENHYTGYGYPSNGKIKYIKSDYFKFDSIDNLGCKINFQLKNSGSEVLSLDFKAGIGWAAPDSLTWPYAYNQYMFKINKGSGVNLGNINHFLFSQFEHAETLLSIFRNMHKSCYK